MLRHLSRQTRLRCLAKARVFIPRRHNSIDSYTSFDNAISVLTNSVDLHEIPTSKSQALEAKTLKYLDHERLPNIERNLGTYKKEEFLNIFENDNTLLVSEVIRHVKQEYVFKRDYKIKHDRSLVKRLDAPLKDYAIFLKYIYEEYPDIALVKKFYHRLPQPQPRYIKPAHFEHFIQLLLDTNDIQFYIQVLSDIKDSRFELTLPEKSKMIGNVFKIGHSAPMDIYNFLKSRIVFDDIVLFNSVLKACDKMTDNDELFSLVLKDISIATIMPNHETFRFMIRHFAKTNNIEELTVLLQHLHKDSNVSYDILLINTLISISFQFDRIESAYKLLEWLLKATNLKKTIDTNHDSVKFLEREAPILAFYNKKLKIKTKLEYLPNFDEETAHICLKECFKRADLEESIKGVFEILDTADHYNLKLWEASYKTMFAILHDLNPQFFTLSQLKDITKRFLIANETKLPYLLSNPTLRTLILEIFIKKAPNPSYVEEIQDKQNYMRDLFDSFYKKYPQGFKGGEKRKMGSSKLHEVIMTEIINEFHDLVK